MNERYLYLALDLGSISFPFLFSFYPKANFSKEWKYLFPALFITAFIFIIWDEIFTQMGIWGFNARYLTGIYLGSLPLEEVLFFFFIPYACIFIYFSTLHLSKRDYFQNISKHITLVLIIFLIAVGLFNLDRWYTAVTFLALAIFLTIHQVWWKSPYMGRFYFAYLFVLIPFTIVNGILTGSFIDEEVVWYNNAENLGIRIGTIPFDDLFYNMLMLLMATTLFEYFKKKFKTA